MTVYLSSTEDLMAGILILPLRILCMVLHLHSGHPSNPAETVCLFLPSVQDTTIRLSDHGIV